MSARPPRRAVRLLERVLRDDPAARAIVGDLHEDFLSVLSRKDERAARRWYWREALLLAGGRLLRRRDPARAFMQDAGYAARTLRRSPGYALFTAGVIGVGVGAATTVFSVLKPFVFAPLPFDEPDQLVWIQNGTVPAPYHAEAPDA